MSDTTRRRLSWLFVALVGVSAVVALYRAPTVGASDDHDAAKALRMAGDILPLSELLSREELAGMRVLEAELEREDGRLVYEIELLDQAGRVQEHYYDAATGEPLDLRH